MTARLRSLALLFALAGLPLATSVHAQPFAGAVNNASSVLGAAHTSGSGTLQLATGTGSRFGTPTEENPIRVTVAARSGLVNGNIAPGTLNTIFQVTGRSGDLLTGVTAVENTTDRTYSKSDLVVSTITAGMLSDLNTGKADDSTVVKLTGEQTVRGKTLAPEDDESPALVVQANSAEQAGDLLQVKNGDDQVPFKIDASGVPVSQMNADSVIFHKITPNLIDSELPVNLNFTVSSHDFDDYINNVFSIEWGGVGGTPEVNGKVLMRDGWENRYLQSGRFQNERHWAITTYPDGSGRELRAMTQSTAYELADGTPLDPFISHRADTWSTLSHFTEDGVQRQKWEWLPGTSEWSQFSPGSALYLSPTSCVSSVGANDRNTMLRIIGNDNKLAWFTNATEKHSIRSVNDYLYINGPSGELAYWTNSGEFNLTGGPKISVGGADSIVNRWSNGAAPAGAGDWAWFVSNTGRMRLTNLTSGVTSLTTESGKLGFYGAAPVSKPTITGSRSDGTALANLLTALASQGLITDSTTP